MKIGGVPIEGELAQPNTDVLVLPRGSSQIVITAESLPNLDGFTDRLPAPRAKKYFDKNKGWVLDVEDDGYKKKVETYSRRRLGYIVINSLQDIEWDTVDHDKPETWPDWEDDLKANGFNQNECNLVLALVLDVNALNEQKIEKAREAFLIGQALQEDASDSPKEEVSTT